MCKERVEEEGDGESCELIGETADEVWFSCDEKASGAKEDCKVCSAASISPRSCHSLAPTHCRPEHAP